MSKILRVRAPKSMTLHKMGQHEIEKLVTEEASKAMSRLPEEFRPVGVNAVSIDQRMDVGGWAEWTRACCDKRHLIDEFTDPVRGEINQLETHARNAAEHIESTFIVEDNSAPHISGKGKSK